MSLRLIETFELFIAVIKLNKLRAKVAQNLKIRPHPFDFPLLVRRRMKTHYGVIKKQVIQLPLAHERSDVGEGVRGVRAKNFALLT